MSWADFGLDNTISSNAPVKYSHLTALRLALRERCVACGDFTNYTKPYLGNPYLIMRKELFDYINWLVWEYLPQNHYYYLDENVPKNYTLKELEDIVGPRVNPKYSSGKWFNQIRNLINTYTICSPKNKLWTTIAGAKWNVNNYWDKYDSKITDWNYQVNNFKTAGRATSWWGDAGYLYRGVCYYSTFYRKLTYYIVGYPNISLTYIPVILTPTYSYLTATFSTYFYCTAYQECENVYQPLNGLNIPEQYNLWKSYTSRPVIQSWTIPDWITKADIINGNSFIKPDKGIDIGGIHQPSTSCIVDTTKKFFFFKDISFDFHA